MGGFENEVIETAIKEAASIAFGGIVTMALSPLVAYLSSESATVETASIALSCICHKNHLDLGSD
jgi:hypothetical protein